MLAMTGMCRLVIFENSRRMVYVYPMHGGMSPAAPSEE
jgi:hypothetical protein